MEQVKTAAGEFFDCDYFNPFPAAHQVNLRVLNTTFAHAAAVFSNPLQTVQLYYGDQYLSHHTKLLAMVPEDNAIRVVLERE